MDLYNKLLVNQSMWELFYTVISTFLHKTMTMKEFSSTIECFPFVASCISVADVVNCIDLLPDFNCTECIDMNTCLWKYIGGFNFDPFTMVMPDNFGNRDCNVVPITLRHQVSCKLLQWIVWSITIFVSIICNLSDGITRRNGMFTFLIHSQYIQE